LLAAALLELPIGILLMGKGAYFSQLLQMILFPKSMRIGEGSALPNMRVSKNSNRRTVPTSRMT
jgi:hypothetical protein